MTAAASAVHTANLDILIFFSGMASDFDISAAVSGFSATEPDFSFSIDSNEWADKFVFEMHEYDEGISDICAVYEAVLLDMGADATDPGVKNQAPLVITEWGHDETDASGAYKSAYSTCLVNFMEERKLGWMLWVLAGSYYIRQGVQDADETYGLLDHTWSEYRGNASLAAIAQLIESTYAAYG